MLGTFANHSRGSVQTSGPPAMFPCCAKLRLAGSLLRGTAAATLRLVRKTRSRISSQSLEFSKSELSRNHAGLCNCCLSIRKSLPQLGARHLSLNVLLPRYLFSSARPLMTAVVDVWQSIRPHVNTNNGMPPLVLNSLKGAILKLHGSSYSRSCLHYQGLIADVSVLQVPKASRGTNLPRRYGSTQSSTHINSAY